MKRLLLLAVFCVCCLPHVAFAACTGTAPTFTCTSGAAVKAVFDWADANAQASDKFRLYVNNAQVGADIPAMPASAIEISFGATLAPGSYQVQVAVYRAPTEVRSTAVTLILTAPPPTPPTGLHIVEVIIRGLDVAGNELWTRTVWMSQID